MEELSWLVPRFTPHSQKARCQRNLLGKGINHGRDLYKARASHHWGRLPDLGRNNL